ncbi:helix-turn-helix transcriptional regulator [Hyphomicrobium sp. 802]|uniref:helix-turn-helix transcriptional regulator n=1 Tax=Hyphomicrobium sp. 802 TaxID=1112272 RepID=UPI00045EA8D2|nr:helix-turn-helix transcriptional regulator [Hyphomicrobium sp. 802]
MQPPHPPNGLKKLRKKHGLTLEELAEKLGASHSHVQRVETRQTALTMKFAKRIADVLNEDLADVLALDEGKGVNGPASVPGPSDAIPFKDSKYAGLVTPAKGNPPLERWRILRPVLDKAGVPNGAIAFVDTSVRAAMVVKPLLCVLASIPDSEQIIARQFVPPGLLITNTTGTNEPSLDIEKGEAKIIGVIRGQFVLMDAE